MGRGCGGVSAFFTRLASGFGGSSLSKSLTSPAPQTSLSTAYCVISFHLMLTYLIQSSNSRMSSSFPFSPTFPQNRSSPAPITMHGSAPSIVCGSTMTTTSGRGFYER